MKVVVISNGAYSLHNFRGPLLSEIVRRGHKVYAFAPDHDDVSREILSAIGVVPIDFYMTRSGLNPLKEIKSIFSICKQLTNLKPDVCFSYFLKPVTYGGIAAWISRTPGRYGLIAGLGFSFADQQNPGIKRRLARSAILYMAKFSSKRSNKVFFQNEDDLFELTSGGVVDGEIASLVGATGVDLRDWAVSPFPDGPITFVLSARLIREKGIYEYIEAARILKSKYSEIRFLLLGGLDDNPSAIKQEEVQKWVDEGIIHWTGHTDVKPWIAKSHVFVLPSYYREGVPRSTQEAMAMGRPVITTDWTGCRDTVIDGLNGFLVQPKDYVSLSLTMEKFIKDPRIIYSMGAESRYLAEDRFDVDSQNDRLIRGMNL